MPEAVPEPGASEPRGQDALRRIYSAELAAAGEEDSPRNRAIAANDYWLFLQSGGGTDAEAITLLVRGLRACDTR